MQPASQPNAKPIPTQGAQTSPPRVLIADDNPQGVELLEAYLSGCNYETETVADGEENAAKRAVASRLDLARHHDAQDQRVEVCKRFAPTRKRVKSPFS